ncbi:hypothetical protein ACQKMY_03765 [Peribacillus frigoritolerans]|uniref:hypothetical protein n=1 Tax=Peribacillus frigoritolerans TaxID=450367 RepID=UPI003D04EE62
MAKTAAAASEPMSATGSPFFSTDTPKPIGIGSLNPKSFSRVALYSVKGIRIAGLHPICSLTANLQ